MNNDEIAERFNARAADYDESRMHRDLAEAVAAFVVAGGAEDSGDEDSGAEHPASALSDVLDVATGTGLVLRALLPHLSPDTHTVGVDLAEKMLDVARRYLPSTEFVLGDAASLDFADDSFDLVTCVTGIQIMDDAVAGAREWRRLIRPGGRIVIATFSETTSYGPPVELDAVAHAAGLEITRRERWEPAAGSEHPHALVIAEFVDAEVVDAEVVDAEASAT